MEGRVKRALARVQPLARNLSNTVGDAPAVIGAEGEDLQNQQVERALEEVGFRHCVPLKLREEVWKSFPRRSRGKFFRSTTPRFAAGGYGAGLILMLRKATRSP